MEQDTIAQWMQAFRQGQLPAALDALPDQVSVASAERARATYEAAIGQASPDLTTAVAAAAVAAALSERLRRPYDQIRNNIDMLRALFMQVDTPEGYKFIYDKLLSLQRYADREQALDLDFEIQVDATDCSYFAFTAKDTDLTWLKAGLSDLLAGFKRAAGFEKSVHFARLVDLLANLARRAIARVMDDGDRSQVDGQLRELAAAANSVIPVNFVYLNDAEQTSRINYWLDQLNQRYGPPEQR